MEGGPARSGQTPHLTRRPRRKIHLAVDERTGQMLAQQLTHQDVEDASQLPALVQQVQQRGTKVSRTGADGSYDTFDTYQY